MSIFQKLPGQPMSVDDVTHTLHQMWSRQPEDKGEVALSEYHASQMNLILHLGRETSESEALACFNTAIDFAQRYPCRVVALCPCHQSDDAEVMQGKLFSQCFIGNNHREMCCCEALILNYPPDQPDLLDSQVSLWIESDLPTYYWIHRIRPERLGNSYAKFLEQCRRMVYDSAVEKDPAGVKAALAGHNSQDLATARALPLRQALGQFLSSFAPSHLVDGLAQVTLEASPALQAEGQALLDWVNQCLKACLSNPNKAPWQISCQQQEQLGPHELRLRWTYQQAERYLDWYYEADKAIARLRCQFTGQAIEHVMHIERMPPEIVISEALFF